MSLIYEIGKGITDSIPALAAKIGTILVLFFFFGMLLGYWAGGLGLSPIIFLGLLAVMAILWDNLDVGTILFFGFIAVLVFFPSFFNF